MSGGEQGWCWTSAAARDDFTPIHRQRRASLLEPRTPQHQRPTVAQHSDISRFPTGATAVMYKQATQRTTEVLSLPPKWLGMYSDFITKNSSAVSQIESALRSLTYIIPGTYNPSLSWRSRCLLFAGRFRESEIASESRTSCAQLSRQSCT